MLFLLRRIRKALLTKNRVTTYFFYAIGEIVLVVVGILIAVSIDDWNESKKDKKQERAFIALLIRDLKADSINLASGIISSDQLVRSKGIYMTSIEENIISDTLIEHYRQAIFTAFTQFAPNKGAIEEIQNAGGLSLIRNDSIQSQILHLYNSYEIFDKNVSKYYLDNTLKIRELVYQKANGIQIFYGSDEMNEDVLRNIARDGDIRNRVINNWTITYNTSLKSIAKINHETINQCQAYSRLIDQ